MIALFINITVALFFTGLINRVRAVCSGRKGPSLFQHLYNVRLLLKKSAVYGRTTSIIFKIVPVVYIVVLFTALCFVPVGHFKALFSFEGDLIFFIYLLALSRFVLMLGALDTGSSFEGMGVSREALYGAILEPGIMVLFGTIALISGNTSFSSVTDLTATGVGMNVVSFLLIYLMIKILIVESGRVPIDDTRTHLELTMIHEVMVLDYSGFDLALINIGGWIKNAALICAGISMAYSISSLEVNYYVFFIVALLLMALFIGLTESFKARNKLSRNPVYIIALDSLSFLLFFVAYMITLNIQF